MATNIAPELVRVIVSAVVYRPDGASFDDISAALPSTRAPDLRYWISDLVAAEILDEDPTTHRYFVLAAASAYLAPKPAPVDVSSSAASTPPAPTPVTPASSEPAAALPAQVPPKRSRKRSPRGSDAGTDSVTPGFTAAVLEAARSIPAFVPSSTAASSRFPVQRPSAQASTLASVLAKPATKLLTLWVAQAGSGGLTRIVLGAAVVVVVLAVLQLIGSSPWLMIGAALLVTAAVLIYGAWRTSTASAKASSAALPPTDSATVPDQGPAEGTAPGTGNGPTQTGPTNVPAPGPRRARIIAAVVCLAIGLGIVATVGLLYRHSRPSLSDVSAYLSTTLAAIPARIVALDAVYSDFGNGSCRVTYRGVIESTEPLFRRVDGSEYLRAQFPTEIAAIEAAGGLLRGPDGPRIKAYLGTVSAQGAAPHAASESGRGGVEPSEQQRIADLARLTDKRFEDVMLVATQTPPKTTAACSGVLLAWRRDGSWVYTSESAQVDQRRLSGTRKPRGATVFAVDFPGDAQRLRGFISSTALDAAKVRIAATELAADIERDRRQRIDALTQLVATGTVYSGTYVNADRSESHRVVLEIIDSSATSHRVSALLRNDGGWIDARPFSGEWTITPDGDSCSLTLRTGREDRIDEAGPLLQDRTESSVVLQIRASGTAVANGGAWHLQRVAPSELAALKAEMSRAIVPAVAATQMGAVYRGTVVYRRTRTRETLVLRFVEQERNGAILRAIVQLDETNGPVRRFSGMIVDNSYRAGSTPIRLHSSDRDAVSVPETRSLLAFENSNGVPLDLRVDGTRLVGENGWYTYEFERVEPDKVAAMSLNGDRGGAGTGAGGGSRAGDLKGIGTARPAYPTATGAYVLSGGAWKALPGNNSRTVQNAAKGLLNLIGDLNLIGGSEARRRAAVVQNAVTEVMFSDAGPVPAAKPAEVVVAYVGQLATLPVEVLAQHPELRTYPALEMAPAKTLPTGARYASLVAIVPGYAGFGNDRVAAAIEQPGSGITVLRCTAPLARGRYIVLCGSRAYELAVE